MFGRLLNRLENPKIPLLGPNIYAFQFWGILLPKNIYKRCFYLFMHLFVTAFIASEFVDIWFIKSNMSLVMNNMKISLLAVVTVFKVWSFLYWQKNWKSIIDYATKADLAQRNTHDVLKKDIITKNTKYCRTVTYLYCGLGFGTGLTMILHPLVKYIVSENYRNNVRNGTEAYVEILMSWVPFDKSTLSGYIAAEVYQTYGAIYGLGWMTSFDTFAMVIMVFMKVELQMLKIDSSKIYDTEEQPVADDVAKERLRECHNRHVELVKYVTLFDSCLSPIMFLYMCACSIVLCVTAYQITIETSAVQKFLASEYLVFALAHLFNYCWHSHDVLLASQELMAGPYESLWYMRNAKKRKDMYILIAQFNKGIVFSAGPFAQLTLSTFISVIKGAYSYYTLLSKQQHHE